MSTVTESWVTQSQELMQAWTEAQARLWGDWADMAAQADWAAQLRGGPAEQPASGTDTNDEG